MRMTMILLINLLLTAQLFAQSGIELYNPGERAVTETVIEIPWKTVLKAYPKIDTTQLQVLSGGENIPYQLERQGKSNVQNLLVQLSIEAKKSVTITFKKAKPAPVVPKAFCRFVPERFDDFAWENDRIAFRIYGAALNGRADNAYGTDIWAKRTSDLVLDKWYKQNDYHKDHGEGLDYYQVGLTLGAGDIGVFLKDSIQFIHNYRSYEILDNGPLRATFRVNFDPHTFNGTTVHEERTVSLDAGSQLSKVQVRMQHSFKNKLPVVVGITLRAEKSSLLLDETAGVLGYWEPRHGDDGTLGIGCVFPTLPRSMFEKYAHGLARLDVASGETLTYYTGGAWDKAGRISSSGAWFDYLKMFAQQVKSPIAIKVK
ncbi:DUF4861 family protein [Dyadobacter luticola]|uniref:DUF4861 domain-containing protein n=1 Tax=Dyadobacter luticola TaxID=1979387 RepID=A0A5R9KYY5_9BACT|nr:DUF4861 family protein [Dyadobacter luticola]TLV01522.1 DUF4861 domain-containing protein [Dyadobacter luticola]